MNIKILIEDMDYKNLIIRIIFSFIIIILYFSLIQNKYILFFVSTIIYLVIFYEILKHFSSLIIMTLLYLFISYLCFVYYLLNYFDIYEFNLFIVTVILFDTFSYLIGSLYGKNKILKKISPNKSVEGLLGGVLFANLFIFFYILFILKTLTLNNFIFVNFIIIFSFFGDLIESALKRNSNIKNSSNYLPGHGGFFDRFDSIIFSIFFLFFYKLLIL